MGAVNIHTGVGNQRNFDSVYLRMELA